MGYGRKSELRDGREQVFCSHCHQFKDVAEFNLRTPLLRLYQYYCRSCQADIDRVNHAAQAEKQGRKPVIRRSSDSDVSYCSREKVWKPKSEFNIRDARKGLLQYVCKDCQREQDRQRYAANPEHVKELNKASSNRARDKAREHQYNVLSGSKCKDCGTTDPAVLTFDHIKGKKKHNIGEMVTRGMSIESIYDEMDKTEIVCFNCHMKREQKRRGMFRSLW